MFFLAFLLSVEVFIEAFFFLFVKVLLGQVLMNFDWEHFKFLALSLSSLCVVNTYFKAQLVEF